MPVLSRGAKSGNEDGWYFGYNYLLAIDSLPRNVGTNWALSCPVVVGSIPNRRTTLYDGRVVIALL